MLEESEIELLRKSKREVFEYTDEFPVNRERVSQDQGVLAGMLSVSEDGANWEEWLRFISDRNVLNVSGSYEPAGRHFGYPAPLVREFIFHYPDNPGGNTSVRQEADNPVVRAFSWVSVPLHAVRL